MTTTAPFGRLLTAMATAFHEDGSLDVDGTAAVARHLVDHGNDGVVFAGTTGESPTLTVAENADALRAVVEAVGDSSHVIAGVGTTSTAYSVELARQAADLGVDGLLLVTPYYSKPSPAGVLAHIRAVAQATDVPVMLYDVPGRTGLPIDTETYARAAELPSVTSVKDATGDPRHTVPLTELGYRVYCGDDALTLGYLAHGADGLVSVAAHAAGRELRALIEAFVTGDHAEALRLHTRLVPAFEAVMGVPNYGATTAKACLEMLGVLSNRVVRGPLAPLDHTEVEALRVGLAASHLID